MATLLVIIYISFISLGLPDSILGSVWPRMQADLGAPLALVGYLSMTITAGTVISSVCSDYVVRKFGTGRVTAVSVLMTALGLAGFALSPNVAFLFLCAVPLGLGAGSVDTALNNFVALHYETRHMNWLHCFWGIGASVGPVIVSMTLRMGGMWRTGYGMIAGLQGILCAVLFLTLPLWKRAVQRPEIKQAGAEADSAAAETGGVLAALRLRGALPVLGGFVFYCAAESTGGLWGASFVHGHFGLPAADAAIASTLYFGAITVGRSLAGFAASCLSDKAMIRLGQLVALAGVAVSALAPTAAVAMAGIALVGLGFAPVYPSMLHVTPARFGAARSQAVMGLEMAFAYVGSTCFPPLFGLLASKLGTELYPWYLLICVAAMLACTELANKLVSISKKEVEK